MCRLCFIKENKKVIFVVMFWLHFFESPIYTYMYLINKHMLKKLFTIVVIDTYLYLDISIEKFLHVTEIVITGSSNEGSNPSLSVTLKEHKIVLFYWLTLLQNCPILMQGTLLSWGFVFIKQSTLSPLVLYP